MKCKKVLNLIMFITLHHFSLGTTGLNQTVFQIIYHAQSVVYCCYSLFFLSIACVCHQFQASIK